MFDISTNGIITLTRGDSARTTFYINLGTALEPIYDILKEDQRVYFGIMEPHQPFEHAIVRKTLTVADQIIDPTDPEYYGVKIVFNCEDTECLMPGVYYYSIKLFTPGTPEKVDDDGNVLQPAVPDKVDTIISKTKFIIID